MNSKTNGRGWSLQVVRGRDVGSVFALKDGDLVLGNAPGTSDGIDLASQEGESATRRMAGRHASLDCSERGLAVRDLESPGGTFVNRQRVLPGQAKPLQTGDVIQLGGVQLQVVESQGATTPSSSFSYAIPGGPTCRSWDEVMTASSQRWEALRGELVAGRLAGFLISIGRADLAPSPSEPGSPDERLDAWLGSLPTTRPGRPELEVHPPRLVVRVAPGGGTTRRTIRVANSGHRLLRTEARVEPPETRWLAIAPEQAGKPWLTVEESELILDIAIPEMLPGPLTAEVVIEGNGGQKRVAVTLEAKVGPAEPPGVLDGLDRSTAGSSFGDLIARQAVGARVVTWGLLALASRLVVALASGSWTASGPESPGLGRVALAFGAVGGLLGAIVVSRRGGTREAPSGAFAGACVGLIVASAVVAACRAVEPVLRAWSTSAIMVGLTWVLIGSGLAWLSTFFEEGKR